MANINKVIVNGVTRLDLTGDSVTADKLIFGYTAHDCSGTLITGTASNGPSVRIVAYNDFPSIPVNGVIGVITSVPVTSNIFQPSEPGHDEGRIWVKVGEYGTPFDLVSDGSINVNVYGVYQSVSGSWIRLPARIGSADSWSGLIDCTIAYNGTYGNGLYSGSWYSSNHNTRTTAVVGNATVWRTTNKLNIAGYSYLCVGPVDITNFNRIYSELDNYAGSYTYGGRLYIARDKGSSAVVNNGDMITSKTIPLSTATQLTLDVSNVTGSVYVYTGIEFGSYGGTRYCQINRIWGE